MKSNRARPLNGLSRTILARLGLSTLSSSRPAYMGFGVAQRSQP